MCRLGRCRGSRFGGAVAARWHRGGRLRAAAGGYASGMELRLIMFALRVLDPRKWRARAMQAGVIGAVGSYVAVRAINDADVVRAVRTERHARRNAEIQRRIAERTERYLAG